MSSKVARFFHFTVCRQGQSPWSCTMTNGAGWTHVAVEAQDLEAAKAKLTAAGREWARATTPGEIDEYGIRFCNEVLR